MYKIFLVAALVLTLGACASSSRVNHMDDEISSMHPRINEAQETAIKARNQANVNEDRIDEVNEKLDRMFEKAMLK